MDINLEDSSLAELYKKALEAAVKKTKADQGYIATVNRSTERIEIRYSVGEKKGANFRSLSMSQGVAGYVVSYNLQHLCTDTRRDLYYIVTNRRVKNELAVPLSMNDKAVGLILLDSYNEKGFTRDSVEKAQAVADEFCSNAIAMASPEDATQNAEFLEACHGVLAEVIDETKGDQAYVALLDDFQRLNIEAAVGDAEEPFLALPAADGFAGYVLERKKADLINVGTKKAESVPYISSADRVRQEMAAPLFKDKKPCGILLTDSFRSGIFNAAALKRLSSIANRFSSRLHTLEREKEHVRYVNLEHDYKRYFGSRDAKQLLNGGGGTLSNEVKECENVFILVADFRGYTDLTHDLGGHPDLVVEMLLGYYLKTIDIIHNHRGAIERSTGDGVLAVFGYQDAISPEECALKSVQCCFELQRSFEDMASRFCKRVEAVMGREIKPPKMGFMVHAGKAHVGLLRTPTGTVFAAQGNTVNIAAKLEEFYKDHPVRITSAVEAFLPEGRVAGTFTLKKHRSKDVSGHKYVIYSIKQVKR